MSVWCSHSHPTLFSVITQLHAVKASPNSHKETNNHHPQHFHMQIKCIFLIYLRWICTLYLLHKHEMTLLTTPWLFWKCSSKVLEWNNVPFNIYYFPIERISEQARPYSLSQSGLLSPALTRLFCIKTLWQSISCWLNVSVGVFRVGATYSGSWHLRWRKVLMCGSGLVFVLNACVP